MRATERTLTPHELKLMGAPSIEREDGLCPFCLRRATERHHIVPRSQGGEDGPTVLVCGFGNADGCHGRLHGHTLHLDWDERNGWTYKATRKPVKWCKARQMRGWRKVRTEPLGWGC